MTTSKQRLTVYLTSAAALDDLREALRVLAPLTDRGRITGSTCVEAAVSVALADVQARGVDSDVYKTMVTLPAQWADEFIEIDMTSEVAL